MSVGLYDLRREVEPFDLEMFRATPIPEIPSTDGFRDLPIEPSAEPLVPLGTFSDWPIFTSSIYAGEHPNSPYPEGIPGARKTLFVRDGVADRLLEAEARLTEGYHIIGFDAYRPTEVQQALFYKYYDKLGVLRPELDHDQLVKITKNFVSVPQPNAPHRTGGAFDGALIWLPGKIEDQVQAIDAQLSGDRGERDELLIARHNLFVQHARMLDFGAPFDYGGLDGRGNTRYLEEQAEQRELSPNEEEALEAVRLFQHAMRAVGMESYQDEYWHVNAPESQMGAKTAGRAIATYGGVELSEGSQAYDDNRERKYGQYMLRETPGLPMAAIISP